ncbi:MAG: SAM-dependent methyltransferase [Pseudonocardiaceae bacterium]
MSENPEWVPASVNKVVPNVARMYDYWLDGARNFVSDRELANKIEQDFPGTRDVVRVNRAFLRRAVVFMVESGIRQFLDIGSGIPTVGNVHEIAHRADPECRVVYVDKEPVAVAHSELLLAGNDRAVVIQADVRDVEGILGHLATKSMLDFTQPIGLLMAALLHFVPDSSNPAGIVARYRDRLAPGSYLALSHFTVDGDSAGMTEALGHFQQASDPLYPRGYDEVQRLFAGFELVEPGLVGCGFWRPSGPGDAAVSADMNAIFYGGLGRKL